MGLGDKWFKLFGRGESASDAARRLQAYPRYRAPHPGPGRDLSAEAARENLNYLLSSRAERLEILTGYLLASGLDIRGFSSVDDCRPLLRAIHRWAAREWPSLYDPSLAQTDVWLASERDGPQVIFSLLMDVSILFGELIVTRRPAYSWSLDVDPTNKADDMISYNRPVVQIPKGGPFPAPIIVDIEGIVIGSYFHCQRPSFALIDDLTRSVTEAISGAPEAYWLQQQAAPPDEEPRRCEWVEQSGTRSFDDTNESGKADAREALLSWRAGGEMFAEIWPAIQNHIEDRELRIRLTAELLRVFVSRDMDPWSVEDVHADVRAAIRRAGMTVREPERFPEDE